MIPKVADIKAAVCQEYNISALDLMSHRIGRSVARPRQVAMYLARTLTAMSLPEIGRQFDRDHTTVLFAVRTVTRIMQEDPRFAATVTALRLRWEDDT